MRRNLINNYRFLDFPQETSIEIKQGDFTPITVKLDSTETIKDDGKDAKVILINTDNEKVFETEVIAKNKIVEFSINKNLPKGRYFLEIVYNQMKFPSKDYKSIIINGSASLGSLKEISVISTDDIKNRFISEAKKELALEINSIISNKFNNYINENQENFRGQSITIANHEFDEKGNLNITFSDQTFIQIPKGKDGTNGRNGENGKNGLNGKDGQSVTTITERGTNNERDGVFVRTYTVNSEGTQQDLISETFIVDGKDGINGEDGVDGTSVGILNIETDNADNKIVKFSDGNTLIIPKGKNGIDGIDGKDGTSVGIIDIVAQENGDKLVKFTNGKTLLIPKGKDGQSIGIQAITPKLNGDTEVIFTDGKSLIIPKGKDGKNGIDGTSVKVDYTENDTLGNTVVHFSDGKEAVISKGAKGEDGNSITVASTNKDKDENTVVTFSDGTSATISKGDKGDKGETVYVPPKIYTRDEYDTLSEVDANTLYFISEV